MNLSMELVLAIVGIIITVILSGPVIKWSIMTYRRWSSRRKWSADLHVEKAVISTSDHYAFEYWHQKVSVDSKGIAEHIIDSRIVNLGTGVLNHVRFVIYCDASGVPRSEVRAWAKIGRKQQDTSVEEWIPERCRGCIRIHFDPPLVPGQRKCLWWGYTIPAPTFSPGDEYYNFDCSTPHYELVFDIRFAAEWSILYARWGDALSNIAPAPIVTKCSLLYHTTFPQKGTRVSMLFGLHHAGARRVT